MEDIMHIQSAFLRNVISQVTMKAIQKQGYKIADVDINDIFIEHDKNNKEMRVHLEIDGVLSDEDLMTILKRAGVL